MKPTLIKNGKNPNEAYNFNLWFWLPPDSPYGNFQLKLMKLCQRIDEANRRIIDSFAFWSGSDIESEIPTLSNAYERHVYANEQAVYLMRRAADELIALMWCLSEWEKTRDYPSRIETDSIGTAMKANNGKKLKPIEDHVELLSLLNEVSNAFKHSFIHSDISLIGTEEPCVHVLALKYNKLTTGAEFYNVSFTMLVDRFSSFYEASIKWLREFSSRHRP